MIKTNRSATEAFHCEINAAPSASPSSLNLILHRSMEITWRHFLQEGSHANENVEISAEICRNNLGAPVPRVTVLGIISAVHIGTLEGDPRCADALPHFRSVRDRHWLPDPLQVMRTSFCVPQKRSAKLLPRHAAVQEGQGRRVRTGTPCQRWAAGPGGCSPEGTLLHSVRPRLRACARALLFLLRREKTVSNDVSGCGRRAPCHRGSCGFDALWQAARHSVCLDCVSCTVASSYRCP